MNAEGSFLFGGDKEGVAGCHWGLGHGHCSDCRDSGQLLVW